MSGFSNNSNVPLSVLLSEEGQSATALDIYNRRHANTNTAVLSGQIFYSFFSPLQNIKVSQITMATYGTASAGLTLARMGLYSYDETTATLLAQTAIDTTLFNNTFVLFSKVFDNSIASSVNLIAGKRYGIAAIQVGTTPASLVCSIPASGLPSLSPKLCAVQTGQTDLPATSAPTFTNFSPFARLT